MFSILGDIDGILVPLQIQSKLVLITDLRDVDFIQVSSDVHQCSVEVTILDEPPLVLGAILIDQSGVVSTRLYHLRDVAVSRLTDIGSLMVVKLCDSSPISDTISLCDGCKRGVTPLLYSASVLLRSGIFSLQIESPRLRSLA